MAKFVKVQYLYNTHTDDYIESFVNVEKIVCLRRDSSSGKPRVWIDLERHFTMAVAGTPEELLEKIDQSQQGKHDDD